MLIRAEVQSLERAELQRFSRTEVGGVQKELRVESVQMQSSKEPTVHLEFEQECKVQKSSNTKLFRKSRKLVFFLTIPNQVF